VILNPSSHELSSLKFYLLPFIVCAAVEDILLFSIPVSETRHKGRNFPSSGSPLMDEARMRPVIYHVWHCWSFLQCFDSVGWV